MKRNRYFVILGSVAGIFMLIIDGQTALMGASEGMELCIKTVIPSLFPFFVLSSMLTSSLMGTSIGFLRPFFHCLGVPSGAESLVVTGFLGGYPVGAQSVASAYRAGVLTKNTAQRMLAFCNNAGPSFLFGMVSSVFPYRWMVWMLWAIHILGAIFAALMIPNEDTAPSKPVKGQILNLSAAIVASIRVMAVVCAWIVLFRIVITFLNRWFLWLLPTSLQVAIMGVLELANGCCALEQITDVNLRFVICSGMLAFGGICVTMQMVSVTGGLSLKQYFLGKAIQTAFSIFAAASVCMIPSKYAIVPMMLILTALFLLQISKKRCIPQKTIV
jgi:hypothetical protein